MFTASHIAHYVISFIDTLRSCISRRLVSYPSHLGSFTDEEHFCSIVRPCGPWRTRPYMYVPSEWTDKPRLIDYDLCFTDNVKAVSLENKEQKSEWYLKINPNGELKRHACDFKYRLLSYLHLMHIGRLPTLIDHSKEDFVIWESSAILLCTN